MLRVTIKSYVPYDVSLHDKLSVVCIVESESSVHNEVIFYILKKEVIMSMLISPLCVNT